jgi:uncharacterized membrane protein YqjE
LADQTQIPEPPASERSVGELVFDVSEKTSTLVREEIELAKAEVSEKIQKILRGSVVGLVAGVFAIFALILLMDGIAWLLDDLFFSGNVWAGFMIEAAVFLALGAAAGLYAYRSFKRGAPPTPDMAIEEAKEIRATLEGDRG